MTIAVIETTLVAPVDVHIRHFAVIHHHRLLTAAGRAVVPLGSATYAVPVVLLAAAWRAAVDRSLRVFAGVAGGLAMVAGSTLLLKMLVGRSSASFAATPAAGVGGSSYPSGHAALASVCWVLTALLLTRQGSAARRPAVGAAALVAAGVGVSMVYGPGHWFTDVVAGWALGASAVLLVVLFLGRPDDKSIRGSRTNPNV